MYFSNFNFVKYKAGDKEYRINDISPNFSISDEYASKLSHYRLYTIQDGARPDQVSTSIYGVPDYYWTFFILNDHLRNGMNGWPLSQYDLDRYINDKFSLYSTISISNQGHSIERLGINGYEDLFILVSDYGSADIHSYDSNRCQLHVKVMGSDRSTFLSSESFSIQYKDILNEDQETRKDQFISNLISNGMDPWEFDYMTFMSAGENFTWDYMSNATYSYEYYDDTEGSHYSVINSETPYKNRISFAEAIIADNDTRSVIKVPRPEIVDQLSKTYFNGIKG